MVTKPDIIELVGVLCIVVAIAVLSSWPWALLVVGVLVIVKAAEMERRQ